MKIEKNDDRLVYTISDYELYDIFNEKVREDGHASVSSFLNDRDVWGMTVSDALNLLTSAKD
jgi:hypothetical protein